MPVDNTLWTSVSDKDHDDYLWRLGNLTLLDSALNLSVLNHPFSQKRIEYQKSELQFNKDIANYNEWGPVQIQDRQAKLAETALKIWA